MTLADIVKAMIGKELQSFYPKRKAKIGKSVLKIENLSSSILDNVNIEVKRGEILGIAGILGSGRTTLANTLFGIMPPEKGNIFLNDSKLNIKSPSYAIKAGIVLVPEDKQHQGLILRQSMKFNISLPNLDLIRKPHGFIDLAKENNMATNAIRDFEIQPPFPDFQVLHLSGGNQQKVVISKWLVRNAHIIILDEPTQGIDVGSKSQIYTWMNKFVEEGKSVIFISSDFNELVNMCDRVVVLRKGKIVKEVMKPDLSVDELVALSTLENEKSNQKLSVINSKGSAKNED